MPDGDRCPFCTPDPERVFHQGTTVFALWDAFPVSDGHALLVTRRHVATWFDATPEEQAELASALTLAKDAVLARHRPDGFNVGVNIGEAAGQTVPHLHVHLIPRYEGDVDDPRGGVRHVIPARPTYPLTTNERIDRVADRPDVPLPDSSQVDVPTLSHLFGDATNSYKYLFLRAILEKLKSGLPATAALLQLDDLAVEMAALAWYSHRFYRLSFGGNDQLATILDRLEFSGDGQRAGTPAFQRGLRNSIRKQADQISLSTLLRYVPQRLLTPFSRVQARGLPVASPASVPIGWLVRQIIHSIGTGSG